jgi:hypothetical protein
MSHLAISVTAAAPLVLGLLGCAGSPKPAAATDLGCPEEQLTLSEQGWLQIVNGCGKEMAYVYWGGDQGWVSPLKRAAFDLSCPKEQITGQYLGENSVGVTGCGKKAVYVVVWGSGWVADNIQVPEGESPPPPKTGDGAAAE